MTCFEIVRHTFKTKSSHNNKEACIFCDEKHSPTDYILQIRSQKNCNKLKACTDIPATRYV